MILKTPFIITPRLLPGLQIGQAFISIEYAGQLSSGRVRYRYYIDGPDFEHEGSDLKSGCGGGDLQQGMESLLSFLSAAGESYSYRMRTGRTGDNENLFPANVTEWAYQNLDHLSMLALELTETKELIAE